MPAHAANGVHHLLVDMQVRCVDGVAAHEDADDFTEDDLAGWTHLQRGVATALKCCGGCENAWAAHHLARHGFETRLFHLVDARTKFDGADLHLVHECVVADMHGEFTGLADVAGRILEAHVGVIFHADRNDCRIMGQHIEEAERPGIGATVSVDGCYKRDRARDNGADQDLVALALGEPGEIEMGVRSGRIGHLRPRQQCGGFQAECGATGFRTRPWSRHTCHRHCSRPTVAQATVCGARRPCPPPSDRSCERIC